MCTTSQLRLGSTLSFTGNFADCHTGERKTPWLLGFCLEVTHHTSHISLTKPHQTAMPALNKADTYPLPVGRHCRESHGVWAKSDASTTSYGQFIHAFQLKSLRQSYYPQSSHVSFLSYDYHSSHFCWLD